MRVAIVHPDLGIGGAERLIVDAAISLRKSNHTITIYTSHYDPSHCFPETREMDVRVCGDWIPRNVFGSFHLLFAAIRAIYLAFCLLLSSDPVPDVIIADQITFHLPLLRMKTKFGLLFYCHFPDKLLAPKSNDFLRVSLYRKCFDSAEERCLAIGADKIVVNSEFTQGVFIKEFKSIRQIPDILYPGVKLKPEADSPLIEYNVLLSLNRFERKKDLNLAVEAFRRVNQSEARLIVAGGYDRRISENQEHLQELEILCDKLGLSYATLYRGSYSDLDLKKHLIKNQVLFLPSVSDELKEFLMRSSVALLYTPSNEHFGIVPIEAMSWGLPVVAIRSGGPKETVIDGIVGYLCEADPDDMARCIKRVLENGKEFFKYKCRDWIESKFSFEKFTNQLEIIINDLKGIKK